MKRISIFIVLLLIFALVGANYVLVGANEELTKNLETNLTGLTVVNGEWKSVENGIFGNNDGLGNCFIMSDVKMDAGVPFRYTADIAVDNIAGGIVFGVDNPESPEDIWYCMNIDAGNKDAVLIRLFKVDHNELIWTQNIVKSDYEVGKTYNFKIEVNAEGDVDFFIDNEYIQTQYDTGYEGGYLGIVTCVSPVTFNNINYEVIVTTPTPEPTNTPEPTETPEATEVKETPKVTKENKDDGKTNDNTIYIYSSIALAVIIIVVIVLIVMKKRK